MTRKFAKPPNNNALTDDESTSVVKLPKSGGCIDRDEATMRQLRRAQVRAYFFGAGPLTLNPYTQTVDFSYLTIYRIVDGT